MGPHQGKLDLLPYAVIEITQSPSKSHDGFNSRGKLEASTTCYYSVNLITKDEGKATPLGKQIAENTSQQGTQGKTPRTPNKKANIYRVQSILKVKLAIEYSAVSQY
jgi:hypothetical protein